MADLGANIGAHSLILAKLGFSVTAFEPDPAHGEIARENLENNSLIAHVNWNEEAVVPDGTQENEIEFVRVVGNTTSSHVLGSKEKPYGELERFQVLTRHFSQVLENHDLVKVDVEGLEADLLEGISQTHEFQIPDLILEVGSAQNAVRIFRTCSELGLNMFPQKLNWQRANSESELPTSYKQGSLFISSKGETHW